MSDEIDLTRLVDGKFQQVQTRDGRPARIVAVDCRFSACFEKPIVALVTNNNHDLIHSYTLEGRYCTGGLSHPNDLVPEVEEPPEVELNTVDEIIEVMQAMKADKVIERLDNGVWSTHIYFSPNLDFSSHRYRVLDENRKKVQRMVDVMLAYGRGEKIEYRLRLDTSWNRTTTPCWNWDSCDYRVQPK